MTNGFSRGEGKRRRGGAARTGRRAGRGAFDLCGGSDRLPACGDGTRIVLRLIFRFFGFLFSWLAIGSIMALAALAAVFTIYGKDLPDYAQLEVYEPATLSRIYSGAGRG